MITSNIQIRDKVYGALTRKNVIETGLVERNRISTSINLIVKDNVIMVILNYFVLSDDSNLQLSDGSLLVLV